MELQRSRDTVIHVLKKNKFHAYKQQKHQRLTVANYELRYDYCSEMLQRIDNDPNFLNNILWSDECMFRINGTMNKQTYR